MSPSSPDSSAPAGGRRRLLVVMRHGRAEPYGSEDHRRRLTGRGARDARAAGEWLAEQGYVPTHALVSTAVRTRSTWKELAAGCSAEADVRHEQAVYTADPESAIEVIRTCPEEAEVVVYVGHNPTAASLAVLLDDGEPDPSALRALSEGFPPAALAVLEVPGGWPDLAAGTAHLVDFHVGRG